MRLPFYTIGHSNRSLEEFVELLGEAKIDLIADVRKIPRSRANPQFNQDTLPETLAKHGFAYEHMAALGGRRGRTRLIAAETNAFWTNESFRNYADYALTPEFATGFAHLRDTGRTRLCAIMCSEAVWWRCHRRIVADYLLVAGETVFHIMSRGRITAAQLTSGAVIQESAKIIYRR